MTQLSINTTQNVNINFTAASVGDRIFAQLLDFLVMIAYAVVVGFILDLTGLAAAIEGLDNWSKMAIYLLIYSPIMFYTIVQESLWEGQTIGKRIMKTKVKSKKLNKNWLRESLSLIYFSPLTKSDIFLELCGWLSCI